LPSRFRFHGHAIGAGGRINHPFQEFIEVQAAAALPQIGGHGSAQSSNFHYRDILRFRHAQSEVTGSRSEGPEGKPVHKTLLRSQVEGLDIMGMVTADRVEVRLVSFTDDEPDGEPCFKFTGSYFENLKVAGVPVKVHLCVDVFDRLHKHRHLVKSYEDKDKGEFRQLFDQLTLKGTLKNAPDRVQKGFQQAPNNNGGLPHINGMTCLSLVKRLEPERDEFKCWGHVIYIQGFGTIHLAELTVSKLLRRVTMVRVNLGSPTDGELEVGTAEGNGSPY
jgi:hypothetical protein